MGSRLRAGAAVAAVAVASSATAAWAAHRFADVGGDDVHAAAIEWLVEAGITTGCDDEGTAFCPSDPVTRAQLATLLRRLAGADP